MYKRILVVISLICLVALPYGVFAEDSTSREFTLSDFSGATGKLTCEIYYRTVRGVVSLKYPADRVYIDATVMYDDGADGFNSNNGFGTSYLDVWAENPGHGEASYAQAGAYISDSDAGTWSGYVSIDK